MYIHYEQILYIHHFVYGLSYSSSMAVSPQLSDTLVVANFVNIWRLCYLMFEHRQLMQQHPDVLQDISTRPRHVELLTPAPSCPLAAGANTAAFHFLALETNFSLSHFSSISKTRVRVRQCGCVGQTGSERDMGGILPWRMWGDPSWRFLLPPPLLVSPALPSPLSSFLFITCQQHCLTSPAQICWRILFFLPQ